MIASMILTEHFWKFRWKVALMECYYMPHWSGITYANLFIQFAYPTFCRQWLVKKALENNAHLLNPASWADFIAYRLRIPPRQLNTIFLSVFSGISTPYRSLNSADDILRAPSRISDTYIRVKNKKDQTRMQCASRNLYIWSAFNPSQFSANTLTWQIQGHVKVRKHRTCLDCPMDQTIFT